LEYQGPPAPLWPDSHDVSRIRSTEGPTCRLPPAFQSRFANNYGATDLVIGDMVNDTMVRVPVQRCSTPPYFSVSERTFELEFSPGIRWWAGKKMPRDAVGIAGHLISGVR
jgi:hypothetical protein